MSTFRVVEHSARCQHIRERFGGVEPGHENELRLAVKQYIPLSNTRPSPGDVTIVANHANAFPKELYEPLWDELSQKLEAVGKRIRSIWISDMAQQGQSFVLNEDIIGNDPSWFDHSRDVLSMINQFQDDMPAPIIGIGHSMGGMQMTHVALFHPRLLQGLILIDPVMQLQPPGVSYADASTYRRDIWPSREEAAEKFKANKFYQTWDPRVLDKWIEFGLRDLPTATYSESASDGKRPVTLTTPKAMEVFTFLRPLYEDKVRPQRDNVELPAHPETGAPFPFDRPEPPHVFSRLPELKPGVLYIFGGKSDLSPPAARKSKMDVTGTGPRASGGAAAGRVKEAVLDCGHLVPMELVSQCAEACASFIDAETSRWQKEADEFKRKWDETSRRDKIVINDKWREVVNHHSTNSGRGKGGSSKM